MSESLRMFAPYYRQAAMKVYELDATEDILFVVYTDRIRRFEGNREVEVTRLISARYATEFERGLYYGKNSY